MSDLVENPKDRFSYNEAHFIHRKHMELINMFLKLWLLASAGLCGGGNLALRKHVRANIQQYFTAVKMIIFR